MSMITPHAAWYRLRALVRKRAVERDVNDELAFHMDMETERLVASGVGRREARVRAMRAFGDTTRVREECLDERGVRPLEDLARDVRFGARMLQRSPGLAIVAAITLAVGIGAATTVFSVIDGVLLKPLPYGDAERIVTLRQRNTKDGTLDDAAPANFFDWRERTRTLEHLSAAVPFGMDYRTPDGMISLETWLVSSDFFTVLGGRARLGRTFRPEEFAAGSEYGPADRVVVLGHATWHRHFGGDSSIVGRSITLDGKPFTVVGVMGPEFQWPQGRIVWAPLTITEEDRQERGSAWWTVLGHLRPGSTIDGVRREMALISSELAEAYPTTNSHIGVEVTLLVDALLGEARPALTLLAAAVGLLLLIACANVANIVLGRTITRAREFAVRGALGARPERLARQMVTEVLVVAILGTVLGVLAATWAIDLVHRLTPRDIPRIDGLAIDARVLVFASAIAIVAAVLAGALPAVWVARGNLADALKEGARASTSGPRTRAIRGGLVVGQVTLATILLLGAGLLARSFTSLLRVERGYDTTNVATGTVQAWQHYPDPEKRAEFVRHAVERLRAVPGVRFAGATSSLPLAGAIAADEADYALAGQPRLPATQWPSVHAAIIAGSYFEALRTPVRAGRRFDSRDGAGTLPVAIVNTAFSRQHWPIESAVGQRIVVRMYDVETVREIVGVVGDMRHEGLHAAPRPTVFLPHSQLRTGAMTFVVRTERDPAAVLRSLHREITALNPSMPVEDLTTMNARLSETLQARRFHLFLLGAFSLGALVLAAIGVYGVMSHITAERTHEIGIRMALGARARTVMRLVMRNGMTVVLIGILLGLVGAAAGARGLGDMLFGTNPYDPATYAAVVLVMVVTAVFATGIPALRATRTQPTEALRT